MRCYNRAHPRYAVVVTLHGSALTVSCSVARRLLCFHFKKAEVKGIILRLLQLQELKERSLLLNHFLIPSY